MTTPTQAQARALVEEVRGRHRHRKDYDPEHDHNVECVYCLTQVFPCDASRLATALEASLAREEGLRLALAGLVDAEWMVTHDWGGDREAVLKVAREALASTGGGE
jgi:hypothetical protein